MYKSHLIFLHGALGCNAHWKRFLPYFNGQFEIHNLNFPAHGNSVQTLHNYSYPSLTGFVKDYILQNNIRQFNIIGYSLGGYIGLDLVLQNIPGFNSLITLATKLNWDTEIAEKECSKLTIENLHPIIEKLKQEHGEHTHGIIEISKEIISSIGSNPINKNQFFSNTIPAKMLLGSNDRMVTREEIIAFTDNLHCASYEILEGQPHSLEKMDTNLIAQTCLRLLGKGMND